MTRFHSAPALLFCLPFFSCLSVAGAEPPALSVAPGERATATAAAASYVFPAAYFSADTPLTHTFLLRSGAKKTLTIVRVATSCECIRAEIGGSGRLPIQVPPGAAVPVALRLSPRRLLPGPFSKSVWLYWPGGPRDGLRLELRGTMRDDSAPVPPVSASH